MQASASFKSQPRDRVCISEIEKPYGNSLVQWEPNEYNKKIQSKNLADISKKMKELDLQRESDLKEQSKIMVPQRRRQLFEAEKHRNKIYSQLKNEKLLAIKQKRIIEAAYPSGILGVDSPERIDKSPNYLKFQKDNDMRQKRDMDNRINRAKNIMNHTSPSPNIQFFNESNTKIILEKPRGPKRTEEVPNHYHNTHEAIFKPEFEYKLSDRSLRLKELCRGSRAFNIISGVNYQE